MRSDLPTGTVTFLFTDVEGSTRLLRELGAEAYADALAEHRRVVREACAARGGVEVDTQGDAFFVAFPSAPEAIEAAGEAQLALSVGPIRVRMSDPEIIREIQEAVSIPVMAKCRIGHFVEAQILQALEIDYIDESEVLTPADLEHHVDKWQFTVPFVCGCTNLGEALRRIAEGAAMIRTKGEAGTGDIVNAVTHM